MVQLYSRASSAYCMITSGSMLKSRSSLSLLTSSSRAVSSCNASCRSAVDIRGLPFSLTIISPSFIPPLETERNGDMLIQTFNNKHHVVV